MPSSPKLDAASIAASIELQEQQRDLAYSFIALGMKWGLFAIGVISFLKLGFAYHQRINRHYEISSILKVETQRLSSLQKRFDLLYTIGGDRRLMDEQDQWIAPNRVRVIWR